MEVEPCGGGGGAEVQRDPRAAAASNTGSSVGPPSGLGHCRTLEGRASATESDGDGSREARRTAKGGASSLVDPPSGLGLRRTCQHDELSSEDGSGGALSSRDARPQSVRAEVNPGSDVGPQCSLRQRRASNVDEGFGRGASRVQIETSAVVHPENVADVGPPPVPARLQNCAEDWVRRPRGVTQSAILSCSPASPGPLLMITQNGECIHSGRECRPMQCSGQPILRGLCPHCYTSGVLPARYKSGDRVERKAYFTKSGHFVHDSAVCPAISTREELAYRRFCKCCRWG